MQPLSNITNNSKAPHLEEKNSQAKAHFKQNYLNAPESHKLTIEQLQRQETIKIFRSFKEHPFENYVHFLKFLNDPSSEEAILELAQNSANPKLFSRITKNQSFRLNLQSTVGEAIDLPLAKESIANEQLIAITNIFKEVCEKLIREFHHIQSNYESDKKEWDRFSKNYRKHKDYQAANEALEKIKITMMTSEIFKHAHIIKGSVEKIKQQVVQFISLFSETNSSVISQLRQCQMLQASLLSFQKKFPLIKTQFFEIIDKYMLESFECVISFELKYFEHFKKHGIELFDRFNPTDKFCEYDEIENENIKKKFLEKFRDLVEFRKCFSKFMLVTEQYIFNNLVDEKGYPNLEEWYCYSDNTFNAIKNAYVLERRKVLLSAKQNEHSEEFELKELFNHFQSASDHFKILSEKLFLEVKEQFSSRSFLSDEDMSWLTLWDEMAVVPKPLLKKSKKTQPTQQPNKEAENEEIIESPPEPNALFLKKDEIAKLHLQEIVAALQKNCTEYTLSAFTNLISEGVESLNKTDNFLSTLNQDIADHLRLAAIGVENFITALQSQNAEKMGSTYLMLLLDWYLILELSLDVIHYKKNQEVPYCHSLMALSKLVGVWENLSKADQNLFRELNNAMMWARYPASALLSSENAKPESLKFLKKYFENELDSDSMSALAKYAILMHQNCQAWIIKYYGLEKLAGEAFDIYNSSLQTLTNIKSSSLSIHSSPDTKIENLRTRFLKKISTGKNSQPKVEFKNVLYHLKRLEGANSLALSDDKNHHNIWHFRNIMFTQWAIESIYLGRLSSSNQKEFSHDFRVLEAALSDNPSGSLEAMDLYFGKALHYTRLSKVFGRDITTNYLRPFEQSLDSLPQLMHASEISDFQVAGKKSNQIRLQDITRELFKKTMKILMAEIEKI